MGRPVPRTRYVARGEQRSVERITVMSAGRTEAEGVAAAAGSGNSQTLRGSLLDTLLGTLRDSVVRDLAWLLLSADLLRPQPPCRRARKPVRNAPGTARHRRLAARARCRAARVASRSRGDTHDPSRPLRRMAARLVSATWPGSAADRGRRAVAARGRHAWRMRFPAGDAAGRAFALGTGGEVLSACGRGGVRNRRRVSPISSGRI